nr:hypothetical protein [Paenibacillus faecis]
MMKSKVWLKRAVPVTLAGGSILLSKGIELYQLPKIKQLVDSGKYFDPGQAMTRAELAAMLAGRSRPTPADAADAGGCGRRGEHPGLGGAIRQGGPRDGPVDGRSGRPLPSGSGGDRRRSRRGGLPAAGGPKPVSGVAYRYLNP